MSRPAVSRLSAKTTGNWGVLGGAFNPVHLGHLKLAGDVAAAKRLDGVLLIPSYKAPHKPREEMAPYHHRVAMLRLAISDESLFEIIEIEKEQRLSGYTLDTMLALKKRFPLIRFFFIIGEDILGELHRWHKPERLLEEVSFLVGSRPVEVRDGPKGLPSDRIERVPTRVIDVSSTEVRRHVSSGINEAKLAQLVGDEVAAYILKHSLYQ